MNKIALTPLTLADALIMFDWINNREQVLFNAPYKPISEFQHQSWFESIQKRNDLVIFGIRLLKNNQLIGSCQLHSINYIHRCAELQIRIGEVAEQGKGYGTEAVKLLLQFAFQDLNLNRVYLHVFSHNSVAIKLYHKIGFIQEGRLRQSAYIDGKYLDIIIMGLLRNEYEKQENSCDSPT